MAIVTGGTAGLGKAIAEVFAENGMNVIICGRDEKRGRMAEAELRQMSGGVVDYICADVSKDEDMIALVDATLEKYGALHVMVNNAGVPQPLHQPIHDLSSEEFSYISEINFKGVFLGMKYAVQGMLKSKSRNCSIINIGSICGILSTEGDAIYDSVKSALVGLTKCAALDYACHDITVNGVFPGTFKTEILNELPPEDIDYIIKTFIPAKRFGDPREIGYMCLFLASDLARYVTGSLITVDGAQGAGNTFPGNVWTTKDTRI